MLRLLRLLSIHRLPDAVNGYSVYTMGVSDSKSRRTLIVEDDPEMRMVYASLLEHLAKEGFTALFAEDAERALGILRREEVDLMVLDWVLPGISGETLLQALRAHPKTRSLGVLMVTGRNSIADEIQALDVGADDFLAKPFDEHEFLARLRSLGRRLEFDIAGQRPTYLPGLAFDPAFGLLRVGGNRVQLKSKERDLLGFFLHRPNVVHAPAYLWEALWGYESASWEEAMIAAVSSLRRKLGPEWGPRLKVLEDGGYTFEMPN